MQQVAQIQQRQTQQGPNGEVTIEVQRGIPAQVMTRNVSREDLPLNDNSEMWLRRLASLSQGHLRGARQ